MPTLSRAESRRREAAEGGEVRERGRPEPARRLALRVAVTERCNLRCGYCMPTPRPPREAAAPPLELERLAELIGWIGRRYRLEKVRLTGGEPTLRPGLVGLVRRLADDPAVPEITMTTNGVRLAKLAAPLAAAGLARVNVSLDTLDPEGYRKLTRGGEVPAVLAGLRAAREAGLGPVKVNSVLRRSTWREDVPALLDLAVAEGLEVRFLEVMRTGPAVAWATREMIAAAEVMTGLPGLEVVARPAAAGSATARVGRVRWRGALLSVGWVTPVSLPFCAACNRLRLDPRGRLRRCLMDSAALDVSPALGGPVAAADVARRLDAFIERKLPPDLMMTRLPMVSLGG